MWFYLNTLKMNLQSSIETKNCLFASIFCSDLPSWVRRLVPIAESVTCLDTEPPRTQLVTITVAAAEAVGETAAAEVAVDAAAGEEAAPHPCWRCLVAAGSHRATVVVMRAWAAAAMEAGMAEVAADMEEADTVEETGKPDTEGKIMSSL